MESLTNRSAPFPTPSITTISFSVKFSSIVHESLGSLQLLLYIQTANDASLSRHATEAEPKLLNGKGKDGMSE